MPWALDLMAFHPRLYISPHPAAKQLLPGYYSSLGAFLHQAYILRVYESCTRSKTVPLFRSVVQLYTPLANMAKLTPFFLALSHLSSFVHGLPAGSEVKREPALVAAREITLTDVSVTTSYSTAITSLQSASPTVEPTNSGVCYYQRPLPTV
jgi:hypothetical protein